MIEYNNVLQGSIMICMGALMLQAFEVCVCVFVCVCVCVCVCACACACACACVREGFVRLRHTQSCSWSTSYCRGTRRRQCIAGLLGACLSAVPPPAGLTASLPAQYAEAMILGLETRFDIPGFGVMETDPGRWQMEAIW